MTKQELRNNIRKEQERHTAEELSRRSETICRRILCHPLVAKADTVVAYWCLPDEPDICRAIDVLYSQGKEVLLPCVTSDTEMVLRRYKGQDSMYPGAFGILEPCGEIADTQVLKQKKSVVLVPGVAFDRNGNRLGRGKGYYDRFLHKAGHPYTIGICHEFQIVGQVPCGKYDIAMNEVAEAHPED